ncbi:hypothetical protein [Candidatus Methanodesulfokora washburnensis]|uniref:Uncharacterized protein n=2 Tax=Candidatus Methanodesulfokora washburnensis TaxID=2478471 RepID=A0A3R9RTF2_9CREN|nr:hypothetical protein [Candidatus Methanodesulfokores washburnensis]RSN78325.1 hypothetical protein D6D85_01180 [Candidatus Methanodesulfokores washburnensis]
MSIRKLFPFLLSFALLLALFTPALPTKAINTVTIYVWYQDATHPYAEYITTNVKTGDYIKMYADLSDEINFRNVTVYVIDPYGKFVTVKPSTVQTANTGYWYFNVTSAGQYTIMFHIGDTTGTYVDKYYYLQVNEWGIKSYSIDVPLVKTAMGDVIAVPGADKNGTVTIEVDSSVAQPFVIKVVEDYAWVKLAQSPVIAPNGQSSVKVTLPFIINGKGIFTVGQVKYDIFVVPNNGSSVWVSKDYIAIPEDGMPYADFVVYGTLPTSVTIGSPISITGAKVTVNSASGYTRAGKGFFAPLAVKFDNKYMLSTYANGTAKIYNLSDAVSLSLDKFVGSLPDIGTRTMYVGPVPLNAINGPYYFLAGATSVAYKSASNVVVNGGGTFGIAIKNVNLKVGDSASVNITWDRRTIGSWLVNGDSISLPVEAQVLIGSDIYNDGFDTIVGKNGTFASKVISVPPVKYTASAIQAVATAKLLSSGNVLATNSTGIPYSFAGYHVTMLRDGSPYTAPASGIVVDVYHAGSKVASLNITSGSDFYLYTYDSITLKATKQLDPVTKLQASVDAKGTIGTITDVSLNLKTYTATPKDKEYVPEGYTGSISAVIGASLDVGTYKLKNNLNALSDPVANSTKVLITWDDTTKKSATLSVNEKGYYVISFKADNSGKAYTNGMDAVWIQDLSGKNITNVKISTFVNPGYFTTIDYIGNNQIKVYVKSSSSPFPLVAGKKIKLTVSPTSLKLADYKNAEKVNSFDDYSFYLDDGGYVIYNLPSAAGAEQTITVNATALVPVDLSPSIAEYDFTHSVTQTFKVTGGAVSGAPAVGADVLIILAIIVVLAIALYLVLKK